LSALLATAVLTTTPARADTFQYDGQAYSFHIDNVPDFDQKRAASRDGTIIGLPNGGNMYCVPTSALNWTAYIANHGYPNVGPGPGSWEVSPPTYLNEYNIITGNLFIMGLMMLTDPDNGTGSAKDALQLWLDTGAPDDFIVIDVFASGDWSPRVRDASLMAIFGGVVNLGIGWYTNADQPEAHVRSGGHAVSLVGAGDNGIPPVFLFVNDPARGGDSTGSDDSKTTQSPFGPNGSQFHGETQYFCGKDANGFPSGCVLRTQDRLVHFGSGYMDGYLAMIPKYGLSYTSDTLILLTPIQLAGRGRGAVQRFPTPAGENVLDVALNPIRPRHPFLVESSDVVWQLDTLTGTSSEFARAETGPLRLTYGGTNESLYVLTSNQLQRFDREGRRTDNVGLQRPLDAIAFDDLNQRLVGLSRSAGRLYLFDSSLRRLGSMAVPAGVLGDSGRLTLSINPTTGDMWTLFVGARYLSRMSFPERGTGSILASQITLPEDLRHPEGLSVDEKGNLFVASDGTVYPIDENGRLISTSPLFGLPAGPSLQIARPFTNYDPAQHRGPAWINVLPEDAVR